MNGVYSLVGQSVTGIVEATFDAGYALRVRIGNSTAYFTGVYRPGECIHVTAGDDTAPSLQRSGGNGVHSPPKKRGRPCSQKPAVHAGAPMPPKQKYAPQADLSVAPVGEGGTLVLVMPQLKFQNGVPSNSQMALYAPQNPHMMSFGDNDRHMGDEFIIRGKTDPMESGSTTGHMTELLSAVQENVKENHPLKRRRGCPHSLKHTPVPPGLEAANGRVDKTDGNDSMVGQEVNGFIEAELDAGYLIRFRIGNSTSYLRAAALKTGDDVLVTAGKDVAQVNDAHAQPENQGWPV